ncbi:MAG: thiamine pyrophosphate-binding protein [Ilumatobacteraceae bacterium]
MTTRSVGTHEQAKIALEIPAQSILTELNKLGITHVVTVPDTHQKTLLSLLQDRSGPELIQVCTEDEAIGVSCGLYIANHRPLVLIQNAGFFACLNSVRGLSLDAEIPVCMLIGEYFRDPLLPSRQNISRVVNLLEPTLQTWGIPFWRLDEESDVVRIADAYDYSIQHLCPTALLIGAPTA